MGTATPIPIETYLHTSYHPDCDYVDGEVRERTMGEIPHGWLQRFFLKLFLIYEDQWHLTALPEVRVQVQPTRFRIPDVVILAPEPLDHLVVRTPPILCIEIFSSEDRMSRMQERVADYQAMGVKAVWAVDPWRRVAYVGGPEGRLVMEERELIVEGTPVRVAVEEIFAELDRLEAMRGTAVP